MKVKLVHDYTKYNERLEKGIIGEAIETPEEQKERKSDDNFVKVDFEGITTVDVLWRGLEIVDDEYLAEKQRIKDEHLAKIVTAKNVVKTIGPKEGFKKLEFVYTDNGKEVEISTEDKIIADEYLEVIEKNNIDIEVIQLEGKVRGRKKDSTDSE